MRTPVRVALVLLPLLALSSAALAQDKKKVDVNAARAAFKSGQEFMKMERFADAVVQFKKAYEITKDGLVMGQIALAYEKGGDFKAALESIRVYRAALPESDRGSVDAMIKRYEKLIKDGKSKTIRLPGQDKPKDGTETKPDEGGGGPAPGEEEPPPKKKGRFWTWVALGGAAALAVSALVVGLSAQSKFDELNDACAPNCVGQWNSDVDSVKTRAIASDVLWGTALAAGITAGVLFFLEGRSGKSSREKDKDDDDEDEEEEEEEELVKRIHITPVVGGGTFGLGATLRY